MKIAFNSKALENALSKMNRRALDSMDDSLHKGAVMIQRQARIKHRYKRDTGNLAKSTITQHEYLKHSVGFDNDIAVYGKYQHDGTKPRTGNKGIKSDWFILKAWRDQKEKILGAMKKNVRKHIMGYHA